MIIRVKNLVQVHKDFIGAAAIVVSFGRKYIRLIGVAASKWSEKIKKTINTLRITKKALNF